MNDSYVEYMVPRKSHPLAKPVKYLVYVLVAVFFVAALYNMLFFLGVIAMGLIAFFAVPELDVEYEYLYLDKEISIDKIISKQKRKHLTNVDLNKMEFIAPVSSHELDSYRSRKVPEKDYSSRREDVKAYAIAYHGPSGDELILFEPNEEMLKVIKQFFPRKVLDF